MITLDDPRKEVATHLKTPSALMRPSATMAAREARGLTRSQFAAEHGMSTAEVFVMEKLEANLLFRMAILTRILDLNCAEPNLNEVCDQIDAFIHRTTNGEERNPWEEAISSRTRPETGCKSM